jgi:hypothetical protein
VRHPSFPLFLRFPCSLRPSKTEVVRRPISAQSMLILCYRSNTRARVGAACACALIRRSSPGSCFGYMRDTAPCPRPGPAACGSRRCYGGRRACVCPPTRPHTLFFPFPSRPSLTAVSSTHASRRERWSARAFKELRIVAWTRASLRSSSHSGWRSLRKWRAPDRYLGRDEL